MVDKKVIDRINELAAKARTESGLSEEEKKEREELRRRYIAAVRGNVKAQLDRVRFIEDLSPEERAAYEKKLRSRKKT